MMNSIIAAIDTNAVGLSALALGALALFFVVILTVAWAKLHVKDDPVVEAITEVLPGVNCGGCGLAGCSAYAKAVVDDHGLMGRCGPGGEDLVKKMATILGIEVSQSVKVRPVVRCAAASDDMISTTHYSGVATCAEAQMVSGVTGCPHGCMGLGDCQRVCEFDAIHVIDGLAVVDYDKCVGCGACVASCPRNIIAMQTFTHDPLLISACSSTDKAKEVRSYCKVGCIGCGICVKMAPGMFSMVNNLAVIDYEQYADQELQDKATGKCPRALLVYVGQNVQTDTAETTKQEALS